MQRVIEQRGDTYADIEDNSRVFAALMKALGIRLPDGMTDVQFHCLAMKCTKMARFASGDRLHEDTWIDDANYAVLVAAHQRRVKDTEIPF